MRMIVVNKVCGLRFNKICLLPSALLLILLLKFFCGYSLRTLLARSSELFVAFALYLFSSRDSFQNVGQWDTTICSFSVPSSFLAHTACPCLRHQHSTCADNLPIVVFSFALAKKRCYCCLFFDSFSL